jgi:hypothetical protein
VRYFDEWVFLGRDDLALRFPRMLMSLGLFGVFSNANKDRQLEQCRYSEVNGTQQALDQEQTQ